jgi:hypothetical protein
MWDFRIAARPDRRDDTVKTTIGRVVDDPTPFIIFVNFLDASVKFSFRFETVSFPEFSDLGDDLLTVGVATAPFDAGVEAVHYRVNLQARGIVDSLVELISFQFDRRREEKAKTYAPNPTKLFARTSLENLDIEAMANTVRSSRNTCQSCANDSNFRSTKLCAGLRGVGSKKLI